MLYGKLFSLAAFIAGFAVCMVLLRLLPDTGEKPGGRRAGSSQGGTASPTGPSRQWDASLGPRPRFTDITQQTGISFQHVNGNSGEYHYPEVMGAGIGLFDYNGDGYLDIYCVNGNHLLKTPSPEITNRLFHNNGDGTFTDVTEKAGVGDAYYGQGCCTGDYDNDGDVDLYVSNCGPNILYTNNGDGTFTDTTEKAGLQDPYWGQSSSFLDYNNDGLLDLYVQNYLTYSLSREQVSYIWVGDRKVRDYPGPSSFHGAPDHLYRNNGDGTFTDVTAASGLSEPLGKGMGCACVDLDDDGFCDIFVTNDGMRNFLFHNRGDGTFEETGLLAGVAYNGIGTSEASMGVDVGDFDHDGRLDMIVPCLWEQVFTLFKNEGGFFSDASRQAGLVKATARLTGFNPVFLDYDNDGDLDLFFSNGAVRMNELASADADYEERYGIADLLLANNGAGRFVDVSSHAGPHFKRTLVGRGAAAGDLDNDGDLDLVISNLAGPLIVLRNDIKTGHWITLTLVPAAGTNRDALGTSVWIEAGGKRQRAVVHGAVSYLSQNDRRLHFGLGAAETIERIEVTWPDGEKQVLNNMPADRVFPIHQDGKKRS